MNYYAKMTYHLYPHVIIFPNKKERDDFLLFKDPYAVFNHETINEHLCPREKVTYREARPILHHPLTVIEQDDISPNVKWAVVQFDYHLLLDKEK